MVLQSAPRSGLLTFQHVRLLPAVFPDFVAVLPVILAVIVPIIRPVLALILYAVFTAGFEHFVRAIIDGIVTILPCIVSITPNIVFALHAVLMRINPIFAMIL